MVVCPMKTLSVHERSLAGLARSGRAAIVVPSLFALALVVVKQPEAAGFAVFATFAHLVLVNYDPVGTARFAQAGMLTVFGLITVALGTLVSDNAWLAVGGVCAAGFLSELPRMARRRIASIRGALLLSFLCAVATPAPARDILPRLAGWVVAGLIAQPALLLVWISFRHGNAETASSSNSAVSGVTADQSIWPGKALRTGLAFGFAILLTRLINVEHAFWVVLGVLPVLNATSGVARAFWQEQAGTVIGFSVSAVIVTLIGEHQAWYWLILPMVVFFSTYAASAIGFVPGQAAFTVFAVVLFCILLPQQQPAGILRLEDIAIGGAVSLVVAALLRLGQRGFVASRQSMVKL